MVKCKVIRAKPVLNNNYQPNNGPNGQKTRLHDQPLLLVHSRTKQIRIPCSLLTSYQVYIFII